MGQKFQKFKTLAIVFFEWLFQQIVRPFCAVGNFLLGGFQKLPYFQRGKGVLSIAVILFSGALLIWIASGLVSGLDRPIETTLAVEYTANASVKTEGYVLRQESLITSPCAINALRLDEGQKVSSGEVVAMGYTSADAQSTQAQIRLLQDKLSQLLSATENDTALPAAALDGEIAESILAFTLSVKNEQLDRARDTAPELKGLMLRRYADEETLNAIRKEAEEIQSELTRLQLDLARNVEFIRAADSGYFSGCADGYEALLTPRTATTLSVSQIDALQPQKVAENVVGRHVSGDTWYFLCTADAKTVGHLRAGDTVTLSMTGKTLFTAKMTVQHLGQEEDGRCALLLSCDRYMQEITALREKTAEVIFATYSGLRIPKQAVRVDENGKVGVYVLEGAHANWKSVEILYDTGESYVVKLDKSSISHLWPGDEVIVSATGLYDGKVVL